MLICVVNNDGRRNIFKDLDPEAVSDAITAVTAGLGFTFKDSKELIAYGPGSVVRIAVTEGEENETS
jgi:hypothetical protein